MALQLCENGESVMARKTDSAKNKHFRSDVWKYFTEYSEVTGIQGIRYVTEKRSRVEKIFWMIVILISLAGCIYMIFEILDKYNNRPIIVTFATHDTPVYDIPFPAVSICFDAKYSRDKFNYNDVYHQVTDRAEIATMNETQLKTLQHLSLLCSNAYRLTTVAKKIVDEDFYVTVDEMKLEDTLEMCFFDRHLFDCKDIFTPTVLDLGLCYSFNIFGRHELFREDVRHYLNYYKVQNNTRDYYDVESGYKGNIDSNTYPRASLASGAKHGLTVFFKINPNDTDASCYSLMQGMKVLIHNPWDVPLLHQDSFHIPINKVVTAAMVPEIVENSDTVRKFSPEKRKCYLRDERPLMYFQEYSQSNCIFECITNYTFSECGCVSYYMPRHNDTPICGSASSYCVEDAKSNIKVRDMKSKKKGTDFCDCKPSCTGMMFNVIPSQNDFHFEYFSTAFLNEKNAGDYHWSIIQVYFKNEQFIIKERNELYGTSDLISQLGGLLGLFTGFSLVTAAEIVYFCSLRIYYNKRLYGLWSGPPV